MFNFFSKLFKKTNDRLTDKDYIFESYSLEGEDRIVNMFFGNKKNGSYVDIGAHHPFRFSNTYLFYKKGWRGVNVDADKNAINLFRRDRKDDVNIVSAVGIASGSKKLYQFNDPALNTFDRKYSKHYQQIGYKQTGVVRLKIRKLSEILKRYSFNNDVIDFMSVDVEGSELDVLKSNNWDKYRPQLIIVEVFNVDDFNSANTNEITVYLKSKKYKLFVKTLSNLIYKNED